jgi:acyl transferase domain-containing protein
MMAVEADLEDVEKLLSEASKRNPEHPAPTIACFNGPRRFTVAGTVSMPEVVRDTMASWLSTIKAKILDVTNAFHSTLVESLMSVLETVGHGLFFKEPTLPMEKATRFKKTEKPNSACCKSFEKPSVLQSRRAETLVTVPIRYLA